MSNNHWEHIYQNGEHINLAPYTEIFSFISRNIGKDANKLKILEVGCGVGNNLIFAKWAFNFDIYGIDQSEKAIKIAQSIFNAKQLEYIYLKSGNILQLEFENNFFDVVVDRSALQHNTIKDISQITSEIWRVLKVNGLFYSCVTSDIHPIIDLKHNDGINDFYENKIGDWHLFTKSEILNLNPWHRTCPVLKSLGILNSKHQFWVQVKKRYF